MRRLFFLFLLAAGCRQVQQEPLTLIQIQDRNGMIETVSNSDRLSTYETIDFESSQPYKKVLRIYRKEGGNKSKVSTYHPNGMIYQYLEGEAMRAHGAYREWDANGQLRAEAFVMGGTADLIPGAQDDWLFDGVSKAWDEQGHLIAEISYQKGMLQGQSLYYFSSGQIEREVPFVKNAIEGEVNEFFTTGALKSKISYKRGLKHGPATLYFASGAIAAKEEYTEGLMREGSYYNKEGELLSKIENGGGFQALLDEGALTLIEYKVGRPDGAVKQFTPSGELLRIMSVKGGAKHGEETEFFLSSEIEGGADKQRPLPKLSVPWNDYVIQGQVKSWYPNGQLQSQREYVRNQRSGPSLAWYRNGALMLLEEYEEDRLVQGQYFKMHQQGPISTIAGGSGTATLFDENGLLLRKVTYLKGKPVEQ